MKLLSRLLFIFLALPLSAENIPDSLLNEVYIRSIHLRNPQRALQLLDEAEKRRVSGLEPYKIDILRTMCYDVTGEYLLKESFARRALASDSVQNLWFSSYSPTIMTAGSANGSKPPLTIR